MANEVREMTREGYENLHKELEVLTGEKRQEISERLKEAISYGDISENSEYDAAKDAQAENEDRIRELEELIRTAKVVEDDEGSDASVVQTGRTVTIKDYVYNEESTFKIVGEAEADPFNGKLSNSSLVGEHLLGASVGDIIEFAVPEGTAKYEILSIE